MSVYLSFVDVGIRYTNKTTYKVRAKLFAVEDAGSSRQTFLDLVLSVSWPFKHQVAIFHPFLLRHGLK